MQAPKVWSNVWHFLAFGFGTGLAKKAPGTWGTLAGLALMPLLYLLPLWLGLVVIVLASVFGIWLCGRVADDLGVHDHGGIVWDEMVGIWITLILLPNSWQWWLLGFIVFRVLDIFKPWPISWLDRHVSGGLGVMLDDMLAGLIAAALLYATWWADVPLLAG
ncbi:phosphatidylglycerophosphatase A [Pseudomonas sp. C27(2019)]|uniref:phosphatidylglycerophosphatase A family protein n=1 Tax=Pseudomonas sp. C27(2019) TaxID=2604941 RepID=UPI0012454BF0|nr:phosphatidylglycerophosphatase A [Pseudomonas sp. C27(2019)]QEY58245.1 phosphatidylglycerophosphatase A [Pseudomonas sp. C27(2019)]